MSRSYKKFPVVKDNYRNYTKTPKNRFKPKTFANRQVRRYKDIPSGKSGFKKVYCSWFIYDYRFYKSQSELRLEWDGKEYLHRDFNSYKDFLNDWKKYYIRK